jgi:dienelactone hydrolase
VVWPHGGPWARDIWGYSSYAQFFANRGYAVLQPNFRGSTGYGKAFLDAGDGEWGTGYMQHDITDGVQYLIDQGIADPDRVGIAGISYGGYATLAGLAFTPDLYAAGVSIVGPSNLITLLNSIPPYWESIRQMFHQRMGDPGTPEGRARLEAQSPFYNADAMTAPLLVVQGANDPRVVQYESDQIVVAMRERDRPVEYIVAPDEGHGFRDELNQLAFVAAMEEFLAEHLGGRAQADVRTAIAERRAAITVDPATVQLREAEDTTDLDAAVFDGQLVAPLTLHYATTMSVMGQELELEQTTTAEVAEYDDLPAWRLVSSGTLMGQALSDTLYVARDTFTPLARRIHQGPQQVSLTFGDGVVDADAGAMGSRSTTFDGPLAVDGAAFDVGLGTLPLAEGYRASMQLFDLMQAAVQPYAVVVTAIEQVTVPAGTFEAFVVEIRPADGGAARRSYVATQEPRVVLRQETPLPAQMGGGTAVSQLVSLEVGQ